MKRFAVILSLFAILLSISGCGKLASSVTPKMPLSTPALVSHEGNSTVALVRYDDDNQDDKVSDYKPFCSAVWVDETHILTAHHCVKSIQEEMQDKQNEKEKHPAECSGLAMIFGLCDSTPPEHKTIYLKDLPIHYVQWNEQDGVGKEPTAWHLSHVVGWDEHKDLALLEAAGKAVPSHEVAQLADSTPGLGEAIHICGHPKGMYWTFLEGTVAGYRDQIPHMDKKAGPFMQAQTPIYFGNSGGGAFNNYGELVGIADFLMKLPNEGFFVHLDNIRAFLEDQNLLEKKETPKVEKKVVGKSPVEQASPDPRKDDSSADKKDEQKSESVKPHVPPENLRPVLPPLTPAWPPGLKPQ